MPARPRPSYRRPRENIPAKLLGERVKMGLPGIAKGIATGSVPQGRYGQRGKRKPTGPSIGIGDYVRALFDWDHMRRKREQWRFEQQQARRQQQAQAQQQQATQIGMDMMQPNKPSTDSGMQGAARRASAREKQGRGRYVRGRPVQ